MNLPTEEQIDQLQSLLDAGTPGEWTSTRWAIHYNGKWIGEITPDGSAELVVELHNLAPALLEAARENLRLREALEESLALNINVFSDADAETCSYYSEHRTVIKQAKKALGKETV